MGDGIGEAGFGVDAACQFVGEPVVQLEPLVRGQVCVQLR
jgi:hypothetical protein